MTARIVVANIPSHQITRQRPLATSLESQYHLTAYLAELLYELEFVEESLPHHPEENALSHSLQAFEIAQSNCDDPILIAAALLHDIGKSQGIWKHEVSGAELLHGLLPEYLVWLVAHHMDLFYDSRQTNRCLRNTQSLKDLKRLRQWDLRARVANADVCSVEYAVNFICRKIYP